MPVIKRYANRKLYDTDAKRYVTLDDLAAFIRAGDDVRVVDHVTGEDLTSVTLMQVIFEEEKKIGGLLPQVMLTRLIRAGGSTVNTLRSRLSFLDPFQMVDEEIRKRVLALVEKGTLDEAEGQRMIDLLVRKPAQSEAARSQGDAVTIPVQGEDETFTPAGAEEDLADPEEVEALARQVEMLEQELARLRETPNQE